MSIETFKFNFIQVCLSLSTLAKPPNLVVYQLTVFDKLTMIVAGAHGPLIKVSLGCARTTENSLITISHLPPPPTSAAYLHRYLCRYLSSAFPPNSPPPPLPLPLPPTPSTSYAPHAFSHTATLLGQIILTQGPWIPPDMGLRSFSTRALIV